MHVIPVILSGGSGTRLWPLSRSSRPKQFLPLAGEGERSLFQEAVARLDGLPGVAPPLVVANREHRFLAAEQLREMGREAAAIVLEPVGRNTAPAVAVAALAALEGGGDPLLVVLPADHRIGDRPALLHAMAAALAAAAAGGLVVFGVPPTGAETGYGYIEAEAAGEGETRRVVRFVEKPDLESARAFVASGRFHWNSGMFVFRARRLLAALRELAPALLAACEAAWRERWRDLDFLRLGEASFAAAPAGALDTVVMERCRDGVMVPLRAAWSDLGSWEALWEGGTRDDHGNVASGDVVLHGVRNSLVTATRRLVAAVGVEGLVIVETGDAVLVADRSACREVKALVETLRREQREEAVSHRRVHRPWGWFETVDEAPGFKVKRISVQPGAALSLQYHRQRAEHWVVVRGVARVQRDDEIRELRENQSIDIPVGARHRLENPGPVPLHLVEVQSGDYLGEDDIVRLEDNYGRSKGLRAEEADDCS